MFPKHPWLRRSGPWIAPLVVLLCTAGVVASTPRPRSLADALSAPEEGETASYRAYVVLQAADCASNLEFLRVFARPGFRSRIAVTGVLVGTVSERQSDDAARRLAALAGRGHLVRASRGGARVLASLGYRKTPFLVVVDPDGQVRFATAAPGDYAGVQALDAFLAGVLSQAPAGGGL